MTLAETMLIKTWRVEHPLTVLNHIILKKKCFCACLADRTSPNNCLESFNIEEKNVLKT